MRPFFRKKLWIAFGIIFTVVTFLVFIWMVIDFNARARKYRSEQDDNDVSGETCKIILGRSNIFNSSFIVTDRNKSCGKVTFSQVSVHRRVIGEGVGYLGGRVSADRVSRGYGIWVLGRVSGGRVCLGEYCILIPTGMLPCRLLLLVKLSVMLIWTFPDRQWTWRSTETKTLP